METALFHVTKDELIKLKHSFELFWKGIGIIRDVDYSSNVCQVEFETMDGKLKTYWFELTCGHLVKFSKKTKTFEFYKDDALAYVLSREGYDEEEASEFYNKIGFFNDFIGYADNGENPETENTVKVEEETSKTVNKIS